MSYLPPSISATKPSRFRPSLARAEWIPYVLIRDEQTGAFRGVEGPRGFDTYREAVEASRFLMLDTH